MTALVLLPGMDGTGTLFAPLVQALGRRADVRLVSYPGDRALGYEALAALVRRRLPSNTPYVLLGESFSGPIAVMLAAERPAELRGVVLCCTFARSPIPVPRAMRGLTGWLPLKRMPIGVVAALLMGADATDAAKAALAGALDTVAPGVLRARLEAVLGADVLQRASCIDVPVLYLQAAHDRVVPASAADAINAVLPGMEIRRLSGPHFLLQLRARQAADAIGAFVQRVTAH